MTTDMLTDHRRLRANMVTDLKQAQEFARKMELHEVVEHVDTLLLQHEHRNFNVAVVGEFKRGKSTLINALLRRQVLPANVLPCSATLNRITYGIHPLVEIRYRERDGQPGSVEQITIEQLAEYVTKLTPESERRAADIEEAIVQYPLELCKNGVDIIDTPGLNDEDNMTAITSSVLQRTDAAIFVILATSPFSETEKEFLNNMLTEDLAQVLFVVNRIDSIDDADDRRNVLHLIERRIRESVESKAARQWGKDSEEYQNYVRRMGKPRVFGVSSSQALRAATKGPEELRQTSGFAEFEQELVRFLTHDKDATALRVIANCTIDTCNKILTQVAAREGGLRISAQEFEEIYQRTHEQLEGLRQKQVDELRRVDRAEQRALTAALQTFDGLLADMRRAAETVVAQAPVSTADIDKKKQQETLERLGRLVSSSVQEAVRIRSEAIQREITRELDREIERLQGFATEVREVLGEIVLRLSEAGKNSAARGESGVDTAVHALTGFAPIPVGGVLTGYREAGLKGAAVGGIAGVGTGLGAAFGAGVVIALLGLPLTWPVVLPALLLSGIASAFGGKWATRLAFGQQQVDRFREGYRTSVLNEISKQMSAQDANLRQRITQQVHEAFDALRQHIRTELGGPIEQTQRTLDDLRTQRAHDEAVAEVAFRQLNEIRTETHKLRSKALARSQELVQSEHL